MTSIMADLPTHQIPKDQRRVDQFFQTTTPTPANKTTNTTITTTAVPSSLPFVRPPSYSNIPNMNHVIVPLSPHSTSSTASDHSSLSNGSSSGGSRSSSRGSNGGGSGGSRGQKRDRRVMEQETTNSTQPIESGEDDVIMDAVLDNQTIASYSAPLVTKAKLPARTLLYQLHLLRSDEKLVLNGVGTGQNITMQVRTLAEEEAALEKREQIESKENDTTHSGTASSIPAKFLSASCVMSDGEEKCNGNSIYPESDSDDAEASESLANPSASLAHPLFPDSLDYVRFYLSATQAHDAFLQAQREWRARGVTNITERIMEFQLIQPCQLLVIGSDRQRQLWLNTDTSAMVDETPNAIVTSSTAQPVAIRASPFSKPILTHPLQRAAAAASSSSSTTVATSGTSASKSAVDLTPTMPSLYTSPSISDPLRNLLTSEEDILDGYCVSRTTLSEASLEGMELTESTLTDGAIILRGSICSSRLHMLDDDKKGRWNQQLLTDLFGRMEFSKRSTNTNTTFNTLSLYDTSSLTSSSTSSLLPSYPPMATSASCSSSTSSILQPQSAHVPHYRQSTLQLAPSSFSPSLQAASHQMFTTGTFGALATQMGPGSATHTLR